MNTSTNEYIISGGESGKTRLNLLAEVLRPYTRSLLQTQGLKAGDTFLDMGCGGGHVSIMASELVGTDGQVTGVDFDAEIIRLAEKDVQELGINKISFKALSAYDIDYIEKFDFAYARFLLSHLKEPLVLLRKMADALKQGGKIVIEDIQFSGHFSHPKNQVFDDYVAYFTKAAQNNGQNPEIGSALFSLLHEVGLDNIGFDMINPSFNTGPGKWMAHITLDRIKPTLIAQGLATEQQADEMLRDLEAFTHDPKTIISMPRIFRAWGVKK